MNAWALSLMLLAGAVRAQTWTPADPAGAFDDDNPGAVANMAFGDQVQNKGIHQICDKMPVSIPFSDNQGLTTSQQQGENGLLAGGSGSVSRTFYRYPTGSLAIVDEIDADISLGYSRKILSLGQQASPLALILSGEAKGKSIVVQPIESSDSCGELRKLFAVRKFKLPFPLTASRISAMQVGELWKIPATFQIGIGPQAGLYPSGHALSGGLFISLSYSKSRDGMATLYRVSQDQVRFRVRIDRAQARTATGEVLGSPLPLLNIAQADAASALAPYLSKTLAGAAMTGITDALNNYLTAVFSAGATRTSSDEVVLEYLLNPSDPAQMQGLESALKGDLSAISPVALAKDLKPGSREKQVRDFLDSLSDANDAKIGTTATFAGADRKDSKSRNIHLRVPMFLTFDGARTTAKDSIVSRDAAAAPIDVRTASRSSSRGMFDFPGLDGDLRRVQSQRTVQAVTAQDGARSPIIIYQQQEGFLRGSQGKVAGIQARLGELAARIPGGSVPPAVLPKGADRAKYTGQTTLTVVLTSKAVDEILGAKTAEVVAAYAESLTGRSAEIMKAVIDAGVVHDDGSIGDMDGLFGDAGAATLAESLARRAAGLLKDLAAARAAQTPLARGDALVKLLSGRSAAGLAYEAAMRVVLRLASSQDVGAEYLSLIKGKGAAAQRFEFNASTFQDPALKRFSRLNRRFMQPLPLSD